MSMTSGERASSVPRGIRLPREARRAQLLDAALAVFVESGYHAAGMDEIADRAGVSKPVLYQHFPSKLELYLALLDTACDELIEAVVTALRSTEDNAERVLATVQAYLAYVGRTGSPYRLVFESDLLQEPRVAERIRRVEAVTSEAIADVVGTITGLRGEEARLVACGVVGSAQTGARTWISSGATIDDERAAQLLAGMVWRGISAFPVVDQPEVVDQP